MTSSSPRLGFTTPSQNSSRYYLWSGWSTDFKFGRSIHRVHRNKNSLKIMEKREHRHIQGLSNNLGKVSIGVVRESKKLSGHSYIRRIAPSSLQWYSFLVVQCTVHGLCCCSKDKASDGVCNWLMSSIMVFKCHEIGHDMLAWYMLWPCACLLDCL